MQRYNKADFLFSTKKKIGLSVEAIEENNSKYSFLFSHEYLVEA